MGIGLGLGRPASRREVRCARNVDTSAGSEATDISAAPDAISAAPDSHAARARLAAATAFTWVRVGVRARVGARVWARFGVRVRVGPNS